MDDKDILKQIQTLVEEEHDLLAHTAQAEASDPKHQRLRSVEISLDECWDLLRQRRARRDAGEDPDSAQLRDAKTVEGYKQ